MPTPPADLVYTQLVLLVQSIGLVVIVGGVWMIAGMRADTRMVRRDLQQHQETANGETSELKSIASDLLRITTSHGTELAVQAHDIAEIRRRLRVLEKHDVTETPR